MPVLLIYGLPTNINSAHLAALTSELKSDAAQVLRLKDGHVSVFMPSDQFTDGLGKEIICFVQGLFEKTERTAEVRQKLADQIAEILACFATAYLPQWQYVECIVMRSNPEADGFARQEKPA